MTAGSSHSSASSHKFGAQISACIEEEAAHTNASLRALRLFFFFYVRSFALKFHLVLKAFLYVRFDCFSVFALLRLGRLLRVFSFVRNDPHHFSRCHRTQHIVICSAMCLFRRYKIRSSVFGGLQLRLRMGSPLSFYLALLSRTLSHQCLTQRRTRLRPRYTRRNCVDVARWWCILSTR